MERKCMYCAEPIFESMGYVLPRQLPRAKASGLAAQSSS